MYATMRTNFMDKSREKIETKRKNYRKRVYRSNYNTGRARGMQEESISGWGAGGSVWEYLNLQ